MRALFRGLAALFLLGFLALLAGMAWLAWRVVEPEPLVRHAVAFTPAHIERAKALLDRNDPRRMRQGAVGAIVVSQADLDLALNYLASRRARAATRVELPDGALRVQASLELPVNPLGRYLNLDARFEEGAGVPRLSALRLGRQPVPAALAEALLRHAGTQLGVDQDYAAAIGMLRQVRVRDGRLMAVFRWDESGGAQIKAALSSGPDQERLRASQAVLAQAVAQAAPGQPLRLEALLSLLLREAQARSGGADAAAEQRAALVVLAFYVNGAGLSAIVPAAREWPAPVFRGVTLAGRSDTPQHFMVSAALAASAGSPLSDAVGLYKELDDARRGSGFSFNDLAADRAGTRLGELVAKGGTGTQRLQQRLLASGGLRESDILPRIADLPEFLPEAEFRRRYGGIDQPAYRAVTTDIERRIAALPLYR